MYQYDDPTAVAVMPARAAAGVAGFFTDGNPASGQAATILRADYMNAMMMELLNVLAAAAVAPSKTADNLLLESIQALAQVPGLKANAITVVAATEVLPVTALGSTVIYQSAAAITATMPLIAQCPVGSRIEHYNNSTGFVTVQRQGADTFTANGSVVTSFSLGPGDTLTLESNGVSVWMAVAGSSRVGASSVFGSVLTQSGYKKIPDSNSPTGYIIEQWGLGVQTSTSGIGVYTTSIIFPVAFPNALRSLQMTLNNLDNNSANNASSWTYGQSITGFTGVIQKTTTNGSWASTYLARGY